MPDLTDEEYDALDEYYTKNLPRVSGNGRSGSFAQHEGHVIFVDDLSSDWLRIKAAAEHTTPEAIINALIRKELATAV
ncbi:hypothetical protein AGMMS50293_18350 [Spirochaetia bacterium]|nr:hypothetical protein AGMMS50293_18350 [Spirochaetia bacterium]